jgi:hypothetical protein
LSFFRDVSSCSEHSLRRVFSELTEKWPIRKKKKKHFLASGDGFRSELEDFLSPLQSWLLFGSSISTTMCLLKNPVSRADIPGKGGLISLKTHRTAKAVLCDR